MTIVRVPTYDIPLGMSHKNNKPCHGLILVLIVGFFCQCFVSYLFGRTVLQSRDMILRLRNLNGGPFLHVVLGEGKIQCFVVYCSQKQSNFTLMQH